MSVPAVASAAAAAAASRSSHHKESIRRGPAGSMGKQVRTHVREHTHAHSLIDGVCTHILHSQEMAGNTEKRKEAAGIQGRAPLSLAEISEEQQGPPAAQGHGPNGISLLQTLPSVPDRPLLGKNGTGPLRSCLVHLPPTNRMQPIRIRA